MAGTGKAKAAKKSAPMKSAANKAGGKGKSQAAKSKAGMKAQAAKVHKKAPKKKTEEEEDLALETALEEELGERKTKSDRLQKAQDAADVEDEEPRGVLYIGHIPKGFVEPQMKKFFGQFGKVTRLRLSRSKKTSGCKGYGWVEFAEESVAKIVAQTMHKYLLGEKTLVVELVPKEKQHPALFKGCKKLFLNLSMKRRDQARENFNDRPSVDAGGVQVPQLTHLQVKRRAASTKKLRGKLADLGIDYDLDDILAGGPAEEEVAPKRSPKKEVLKAPKASPKAAPKPSPKASPKAAPAAGKAKGATKRAAPAAAEAEGSAAPKAAKRKKVA